VTDKIERTDEGQRSYDIAAYALEMEKAAIIDEVYEEHPWMAELRRREESRRLQRKLMKKFQQRWQM